MGYRGEGLINVLLQAKERPGLSLQIPSTESTRKEYREVSCGICFSGGNRPHLNNHSQDDGDVAMGDQGDILAQKNCNYIFFFLDR